MNVTYPNIIYRLDGKQICYYGNLNHSINRLTIFVYKYLYILRYSVL